jgi:2-octaprenyl-6-methoxyphenol hydroxylase
MSARYDLVIVGGGAVGSALALALEGSGLSLLLLDAGRAEPGDRRSLALSHGSRLILERLDVWRSIAAVTPIDAIHVSQRGGFGRALLSAAQSRLPALGYVASIGAVQAALRACVLESASTQLLDNTHASAIEPGDSDVDVVYSRNGESARATARLAVLADGGAMLATAAGKRIRDYRQCAVIADVMADRPHGNRAYERFTPEGPIALLPSGAGFALIWVTATEQAERLRALDAPAFLLALQAAFGERAGRFTGSGERSLHRLSLRVAGTPFAAREVLLGNAAQTLHPVAAQGLNLGLRDAWELSRMIRERPASLDQRGFPERFARSRKADRNSTILLTDLLATAFADDFPPLRWLRGGALALLDALPPAKRSFTRRMIFGS